MAVRICAFFECETPIYHRYKVCREHYSDLSEGLLDECPSCGQLKNTKYEVCLNCYNGQSAKASTKPSSARKRTLAAKVGEEAVAYAPGAPDAAPKRDDETPVFFVYILDRDDGTYYIGQTNHLLARLREHRRKAKAGEELTAALVWFSLMPSRADAEAYEQYLTRLVKNNERAVTRMITDFESLVREIPRTTPVS